MRLRNLRKLEEMEIKTGGQGPPRRARRDQEAAGLREGAVEDGRRRDQEDPRDVRAEDQARQAAHDLRRGAAARRGRDRGGDGRARADHRGGVGEGLDPRAARARHRPVGRRVQGRRQPQIRVPGRDHVQDPGVRHQRALLHARRREAPGRARARRAGAAVHRSRAGPRAGRGVPPSGRPQIPGRERAGQGLRGGRGRVPRQHPQGQAGAQRQAAGCGARLDRGGGRAGRHDRREPQDGDLPARSGAGAWRAAAACACSATRTARCPT